MDLINGAATWNCSERETAASATFRLHVVMWSLLAVLCVGWLLSTTLEKGPVNEKYLLPNLIFSDHFIESEGAFIANQLAAMTNPQKQLVVVRTRSEV
jgi:hypothetical protein